MVSTGSSIFRHCHFSRNRPRLLVTTRRPSDADLAFNNPVRVRPRVEVGIPCVRVGVRCSSSPFTTREIVPLGLPPHGNVRMLRSSNSSRQVDQGDGADVGGERASSCMEEELAGGPDGACKSSCPCPISFGGSGGGTKETHSVRRSSCIPATLQAWAMAADATLCRSTLSPACAPLSTCATCQRFSGRKKPSGSAPRHHRTRRYLAGKVYEARKPKSGNVTESPHGRRQPPCDDCLESAHGRNLTRRGLRTVREVLRRLPRTVANGQRTE